MEGRISFEGAGEANESLVRAGRRPIETAWSEAVGTSASRMQIGTLDYY